MIQQVLCSDVILNYVQPKFGMQFYAKVYKSIPTVVPPRWQLYRWHQIICHNCKGLCKRLKNLAFLDFWHCPPPPRYVPPPDSTQPTCKTSGGSLGENPPPFMDYFYKSRLHKVGVACNYVPYKPPLQNSGSDPENLCTVRSIEKLTSFNQSHTSQQK